MSGSALRTKGYKPQATAMRARSVFFCDIARRSSHNSSQVKANYHAYRELYVTRSFNQRNYLCK